MAIPAAAVIGGSALLGGLGGLFGSKTKAKPVFINPQFNELAERFATQRLPALIEANRPALTAYESAVSAARPVREALAREDVDLLGAPIRTGFGYDPTATSERLLTSRLGTLRDFVPDILGSVNRAANARSRALGLGGRTSSIYGNTALARALGENLAPILGGIYSGVGRDAASAEQARLNNYLLTLQLMREREQVPYRSAQAELLPAEARLAEFGAETGFLGDIGRSLAGNIAGMNVQENPIGGFLRGASSGLGTGALLSSVMNPAAVGGSLGGYGGNALASRAALTRSMVPFAPAPLPLYGPGY